MALVLAAPAAGAGPVTSPLTRAGKWLVDDQGRAVTMHGVNVVHKVAPYYPDTFTARDAAFLADEGVTVARIGFIWAGVEPRPGVYDDAYVAHVIAFDQLLARYGIRVLLDFHQDAWGGSSSSDGAPAWATLGGNLFDDFQDFWDNDPGPDGVGIQTHFDNAWRHVIAMIDRSPGAGNIIGLDPFNEPYAGTKSACAPFTPCPSFESGPLAQFYDGVIAAIRSTGDRHVIFPEGIAQNGIQPPSLPAFADPQTAFSFHYYCPVTQTATANGPADPACGPHRDEGVGNFVAYANSLDVPAFEGEFSCNDADDDNASTVDLFDQDFLSWTIWAYYSYSQDPANCAGQGLLVDDGKGGSEANAKQAKLDAIVVPYPQAIAGTPGSYGFDRSSDTMTLRYTATAVPGVQLAAAAPTQIFIPQRKYPHGYRVAVSGARVVSGPTAPWLELVADRAGAGVSVTVTPATDSTTQRPLDTGALPLALSAPGAAGPGSANVAPAACRSRRRLVFHLGRAGRRARAIVVYLDGRRARALRGPRATVPVSLAGRSRGTVRVRLVLSGGGPRVVLRRAFRTCTRRA